MKANRLLLAVIAGLGLTLVTLWGMGGGPVPIVLAAGNTYYVTKTGTLGATCTDAGANACKTIEEALAKASDTPASPDTIDVGPGEYTEFNINVTKSVIIQGAGASSTIVQASINGAIDGRRLFSIGPTSNVVTITNMTIRNGHNTNLDFGAGGGVYVDNATLTLQDTLVFSNYAGFHGGGVYVGSGSATLSGGQIISNSAAWYGGGVYVFQGSATLSGGQIISNSSQYGGGVFVDSGSATLSGGQIISNSAHWNGGGVFVNQGSATLSGGQIISNSATTDGGGVFVNQGSATFTQTGVSTVTHNHAGDDGGGVFVNQGSATLSGGQIISNSATNDGGGVGVEGSSATLTLQDTIVLSNSAESGGGGGLYVYQGSATLSGMRLMHNSATTDGGGLHIDAPSGTLSVSDSCIVSNSDTAVKAASGANVTATDNWWGASTGPSMGTRIPGYGDSVSSGVTYNPFKYAAPAGCPTLTADLAIAKTVSPAADVAYQGSVTYTVTLSNTGIKDAASGTLLTDTLPTEVDFAGWVQQSGADVASDQLTWSGTVTEGESITWSWVVNHSGDYGDVVTNIAQYSHLASGQSGSAAAAFTVLRGGDCYLPVVSKGATP